jgi:hypothetical protein
LDAGPVQMFVQTHGAGEFTMLQATVALVEAAVRFALSGALPLCVGGKRPMARR